MADATTNESDRWATGETSRGSWSAVRGCARLVLGLFLVLAPPVHLGVAAYHQAQHEPMDAMGWPHWTAWVMVACGIGVLWNGWGLRRSRRQKMAMVAEKWEALESRRGDVERVFNSLVGAGHYERELSARYECARGERARLAARIAEHRSPGFFASLSKTAEGGEDEILAQMERLGDADTAIMAARDLFALAPGWPDVWKTEVGPIFQDLDVLDDVADTLEAIGTDPRIMTDVEAFREHVGDHKDAVHDLGKRLEDGQIAPAQALEELDRIANDARTRTAELIEATLATDASSQGRARYARWKGEGISLTAANGEYDSEYWSEAADTDIEYNPQATIRLIANSAGVHLHGQPAPTTGILTTARWRVYLLPMYLDRYLRDDVDAAVDGCSST